MRKCNKCGQQNLEDKDFYKTLRTICKVCHRKSMKKYEPKNNKTYRTYTQVLDLFRKACFRIREDELGLRLTPLRRADLSFKQVVESKMHTGMTWEKYNIEWKITTPLLMRMILLGAEKKELLNPEYLGVGWKTPVEPLTNKNTY
jgi:hypothetical protein